MKVEGKLIFAALVFIGIAFGLYWCVNSGPCGDICDYVPAWLAAFIPGCDDYSLCKDGPSWLQWLLNPFCGGPGPGGPSSGSGSTASPAILAEFDAILNKLEGQSGTAGCSGDNCVDIPAGQSSGISKIGGS